MRVKMVTVTQTRQVRRFEPEKIELQIELKANESVQEAVRRARRTIAILNGEELSASDYSDFVDALAEDSYINEFE